jgi:hypothetical protein
MGAGVELGELPEVSVVLSTTVVGASTAGEGIEPCTRVVTVIAAWSVESLEATAIVGTLPKKATLSV